MSVIQKDFYLSYNVVLPSFIWNYGIWLQDLFTELYSYGIIG